jgi:hypothetical protein
VNLYCTFTGRITSCSICGATCELKIPIDPSAAERESEVYEAYCQSTYVKRQAFVPTDFYVISLRAIRARPYLIDVIAKAYEECWAPKQIGVAVLHGAVTFLRFRPSTALQTFSDEVVIAKGSAFFAGLPGFAEILMECKSRMLGLDLTEGRQFGAALEAVTAICRAYGSTIHLILDECDFHAGELVKARDLAFEICQAYCQVSLTVFIDEVVCHNPLLDLPVVTGGFLRIFGSNEEQPVVEAVLSGCLQGPAYHDAFIVVPGQTVTDFAGRGFQVSSRSIEPGKMAVGDSFFFTVDTIKRPFLQIITFFTTDLSVRKVRVITLNVERQLAGPGTLAAWKRALVAHRLLNEGSESAKELIGKFRKAGEPVDVLEGLLNGTSLIDKYREALLARSGAPFPDRKSPVNGARAIL